MSSCLAPAASRLELCGPGTLDSIREVCVREVWACLPSFILTQASVTRSLASHARHLKTHELTPSTRQRLLLHAQGTLFNRATAALIPHLSCNLCKLVQHSLSHTSLAASAQHSAAMTKSILIALLVAPTQSLIAPRPLTRRSALRAEVDYPVPQVSPERLRVRVGACGAAFWCLQT